MTIFCFILTGHYLQVKQQHTIKSLLMLNSNLKALQLQDKYKYRKKWKICYLSKNFFVVQQKNYVFQQEIAGCNKFWSRYLSAFFACITIVVTFMVYFLFNSNKENSLIVFSFFFFFGTIIMSILLWITIECAIIVYKNLVILQLQTTFAYNFQKMFKLSTIELLKVSFL